MDVIQSAPPSHQSFRLLTNKVGCKACCTFTTTSPQENPPTCCCICTVQMQCAWRELSTAHVMPANSDAKHASTAIAIANQLINATNRLTNHNKRQNKDGIHGTLHPFTTRRVHDRATINIDSRSAPDTALVVFWSHPLIFSMSHPFSFRIHPPLQAGECRPCKCRRHHGLTTQVMALFGHGNDIFRGATPQFEAHKIPREVNCQMSLESSEKIEAPASWFSKTLQLVTIQQIHTEMQGQQKMLLLMAGGQVGVRQPGF
jgi:hypothetical protein